MLRMWDKAVLIQKEPSRGRKRVNVVIVGNAVADNFTSLNTGEFTLEKSFKCGGNVLFPRSVEQHRRRPGDPLTVPGA